MTVKQLTVCTVYVKSEDTAVKSDSTTVAVSCIQLRQNIQYRTDLLNTTEKV